MSEKKQGGEIRVTDPKTGGQKGKKPERYDLIPPGFLFPAVLPVCGTSPVETAVMKAVFRLDDFRVYRGNGPCSDAAGYLFEALALEGHHPGDALARVYAFGCQKYEDWNWLKGYAWSLSFAAACRHLAAWGSGYKTDGESNLPHLAHAAWHCITLSTFLKHGLGTDDLYKAPVKS